jgi:hypothetical protein
VVREAEYRSGEAPAPDRGLLRAIRLVGVPHLDALVHLNEAAVGWRAGRRGFARRTALRAAAVWRGPGNGWLRLLAEALAAAAGGGPPEAPAARIADCPVPGIGVQIAGLLGPLARGARRREFGEAALRLAAPLDPAADGRRREVLSIEECLDRLGLPRRSPRRGAAASDPKSPGNGRKGGRG